MRTQRLQHRPVPPSVIRWRRRRCLRNSCKPLTFTRDQRTLTLSAQSSLIPPISPTASLQILHRRFKASFTQHQLHLLRGNTQPVPTHHPLPPQSPHRIHRRSFGRFDIKPSDVVVLIFPNTVEFVVMFLAIIQVQATVALLNPGARSMSLSFTYSTQIQSF